MEITNSKTENWLCTSHIGHFAKAYLAENSPHIKKKVKPQYRFISQMNGLTQLAVQPQDCSYHRRGMSGAGSREGGRPALWRLPAVRLSSGIYSHDDLQGMETNKSEQTVDEQLYL